MSCSNHSDWIANRFRPGKLLEWFVSRVFNPGLQPCSWEPTIMKSLATTLIKHTWSGQSSSSRLLECCRQVCWSRLEIHFPWEWVPRSRVEDLWALVSGLIHASRLKTQDSRHFIAENYTEKSWKAIKSFSYLNAFTKTLHPRSLEQLCQPGSMSNFSLGCG